MSQTLSSSRPYIGGQAVLEGVMMRAPKSFAVVVRRRDGSLQVRERAMAVRARGFAGWPLVRGIATLVESLRLGGEALRFSADWLERDLAAEGAAAGGAVLGVLGAFGLSLFTWATADVAGDPPPPHAEKRSRDRLPMQRSLPCRRYDRAAAP